MQENREAVWRLFRRLCNEMGAESGEKVIKLIVEELGGLRVNIPSLHDLYRLERDRKILAMNRGTNHKEIAIIFNISVQQVRRVIRNRHFYSQNGNM
ncbi:MAG: Mor transcription activator family protein [Thermodesulfovibrionales bacterium]|jgi:Mor family transcriptional regulator